MVSLRSHDRALRLTQFFFTFAWAALFVGNAFSQPLQPDHFEEALNPQVEISGATRGGVLISALVRPESLETLTVRVPSETEISQLCLDLVTRDGRYHGWMEFSLPPNVDGFVDLAFPTQFRQQLLEANEPYLAVLAGLSADCETDEPVYIPAAWKRPEAIIEIELIINTGHLDAYIAVPVFDGDERRFACERVATSPTIAFNRICTIELAKNLDLMGTEVRRDDFFGNPLPPVAMPIAF